MPPRSFLTPSSHGYLTPFSGAAADSGAQPTVTEQMATSLTPEQRASALGAAARISQERAAQEALEAEQLALEQKHGVLGTAGMQFARGALDFGLTGGALFGAGVETLGAAVGSQGLERFGREAGESASGEAAMEALAFIAGGGGQEGLEAYRRQQVRLDEQERAWPTLSAVSRVAGAAVPAIAMGAVGGLAGAGGGAGRVIAAEAALGAYEGAGAGAQMAYERAAPLLDVWSSMALGSAMGAGAGAAGAGVAMGIQRVKPMQRLARAAFGGEKRTAQETAGEIAREAAGRQAGMTQAARKKIVGRKGVEAGEADISKMEQHLLDYRLKEGEFAGESILFDPRRWHGQRELDDIPRALEQAEREVGQELGAVRTKIDQEITQRVQKAETDMARVTQPEVKDSASIVDEIGLGSDEVEYLREGMRDPLGRASAYKGASPEEVQAIARGEQPSMDWQKKFEPVKATVEYEQGKAAPQITMIDGRHRLVGAKNAGATEVLAEIRTHRQVNGEWVMDAEPPVVRPVKIKPASEQPKIDPAVVQERFAEYARVQGADTQGMSLMEMTEHPLWEGFRASPMAPKDIEAAVSAGANQALTEARGMMPSARAIVDDIEQNVLQKMRASDLPDISETAVAQVERSIANIRKVAEEGDGAIGFERLAQFRMEIDKKIWRESPTGGLATPPGPHLDPLKKVRGIIERHITDTAEKTMKQLEMDPSQYRALHDQYRSMTNFKKMAYEAHARRKNNAQVGLRDTIVGGATLAGGLASGNPLAVMGAMATTAATKWAREHGQGMVALWAYKASQGLSEDMAGRFARFVPMLTAAKRAAPAVRQGAARQIAPRAATMSREEQREDYQRDYEKIQRMVVHNDPDDIETAVASLEGMPPELSLAVGLAMRRKMERLWTDLPRPKADIRGVAWESLSSDDVRRGRAMIQAARDPMSVFNDFEAGHLDYDKAQYTWGQNPGLKLTAQAAVMDLLHVQLTDDERKGMPDRALTQLDYFLDFGGTLQQSVSREFSARIDGLGEMMREAQAKEATQLQTPAAEPTMIGRMMRG